MSEQPDTLHFTLPSHTDAVLSRMNILREEQHFCDITLLLRGPLDAAEHSFCFRGHKVVLAAASDFLRDQFLLHEGQAELRVSVVTNVEVGKRLLLSCYTGVLEVPRCELVTYLTAASALQLNPVVEKCAQIISIYVSPTLKNEDIQLSKIANSETEADTTSEQQVEIFSKQQIVVGQDYANAGCCLKMLEFEANKILKVGTKEISLSKKVPKFTLKYERNDVSNCCASENGKCPVCEEGLEEHLQEAVGKVELNNPFEEPVMEPEILIALDIPKEHTVKSVDDTGSLVPKSYQCQDCDHVFENVENYAKHIKGHHVYECLVCDKSFSQKSSLSHHLRVHSPLKPYRCPLCHSTFPNKASLQYHINLHTGYKPLKCNYCTA